MDYAEEIKTETSSSKLKVIITVVALLWAGFHIYTAGFGLLPNLLQRSIHLGGALLILCLTVPVSRKKTNGKLAWAFNIVMMIGALFCTAYVLLYYEQLIDSMMDYTTIEVVLAYVLLLLVAEGVRRTLGWLFVTLMLLFVSYAFLGPYLPGIWAHGGMTVGRFADALYRGTQGFWGPLMAVSATVLSMFIFFGNLVLVTGGGDSFMGIAKALGGRMTGGPAQIAAISSAFFGMINGSAVANVATTGTFTIPLIKRCGYPKDFAGGVEATASSGGCFSPPIMGAGAFIMAEFLAVPYIDVAKAAAIPAFLFYVGVMTAIYFYARNNAVAKIPYSEIPPFREALNPVILLPLVVPVIVLVYLLVTGWSAGRAAFYAMVAMTVIYLGTNLILQPSVKTLLKCFVKMGVALKSGAVALIPIVMILAAAQVIVMSINVTGLGNKFTQLIISVGGQYIYLSLILAAIITILLGMGMPSPAAYVIVASVIAPALIRLGLTEMPTHLFLYFYACLAPITPPVATAVITAIAISGGTLWGTGWNAVRLSISAFIVPFLFIAYPELIWEGSGGSVLMATLSGMVGVTMLSAAMMGFFLYPLSIIQRVMLIVGALLLMTPGHVTDLMGLAILIVILVWHVAVHRLQAKWVRRPDESL